MKVAAVQMSARLADVDHNLERAGALLERAFGQGCEMVILPEFFPSAVAFHPDMAGVAMPLEGPALELMAGAARKHGGYVGGSFICSKGADNYNTWVLLSPDGSRWMHDKDQPTMWENCWYVAGSDDGVLETPLGNVGVGMCWELVRTRTVRRLRGKVDLLVGGSCWWDVPDRAIPIPGKRAASERNMQIMIDTPARMARLLGAPVVHAAHAGDFEAGMPMLPGPPTVHISSVRPRWLTRGGRCWRASGGRTARAWRLPISNPGASLRPRSRRPGSGSRDCPGSSGRCGSTRTSTEASTTGGGEALMLGVAVVCRPQCWQRHLRVT